jgi:hypothetical protein
MSGETDLSFQKTHRTLTTMAEKDLNNHDFAHIGAWAMTTDSIPEDEVGHAQNAFTFHGFDPQTLRVDPANLHVPAVKHKSKKKSQKKKPLKRWLNEKMEEEPFHGLAVALPAPDQDHQQRPKTRRR